MKIIAGFAEVDDENSPLILEERNRKDKKEKFDEIMSILESGSFLKRFIFKKGIRLLESFVLLRENQRFHWQMILSEARFIFLEIGRRFKEEGLIDKREDIFFLELQEVVNTLKGRRKERNLKALITKRK